MDIEKDFLRHFYGDQNNNQDENFIMCPKIFYEGLTEAEIISMQQLYSTAYKKAVEKNKNGYDSFFYGDGI